MERKKNTWHVETKVEKVIREVEEPYNAEEEYYEDIVVRPKGWFRSEKTESVKKTRTVTRTRRVRREMKEERFLLVNDLGESHDHSRFVRIPAGKFLMGSPASEKDRSSDETQHEVTISKAFEMLIYPVTQALWQCVMGNNPSHFKGPDRPVNNVSWNDAQEFISKLNEMLGTNAYRLPTEAEWEYACRAGKTTPFWTGNNLTTDQANYDGNHPYAGNPKGEYRQETTPVTMFKPNPWGLYDMHGNVWEWCQDWKGDYPSGSVTDPVGPSSGANRVIRGGCWNNFARSCRSANRDCFSPGYCGNYLGFRLAWSLP